jgi:hypothetical protein
MLGKVLVIRIIKSINSFPRSGLVLVEPIGDILLGRPKDHPQDQTNEDKKLHPTLPIALTNVLKK